jgi:hypothetical protein
MNQKSENTATQERDGIALAKIGITQRFGRVLLVFVLFLCVWITLPYADTPIYDFPSVQTFYGTAWYNPYHTIKPHDTTQWKKVNFHAHSAAWQGLSHGVSTTDSLFAIYDKLGYDYASVSHYQRIEYGTRSSHDIPCYEHGYGVWKNHQIIINAQSQPVWRDYLLWQNSHHKQAMLEYLSNHHCASTIVIAHPTLRNAYSGEDMKQLRPPNGIGILEPFNFNVESIALWDSALSAGRIYWGVGHDDTHNIFNPEETGVCWTMLAESLHSYTSGALYAVKMRSSLPDRWKPLIDSLMAIKLLDSIPFDKRFGLRNAQNDAVLLEHSLHKDSFGNDVLYVRFNAPIACVQFIGQNGSLCRQSIQPDSIFTYTLRPTDTYIRVVAHTQNNTILLNPIIRTKQAQVTPILAPLAIHAEWTILSLLLWCVIYALCGVLIKRLI